MKKKIFKKIIGQAPCLHAALAQHGANTYDEAMEKRPSRLSGLLRELYLLPTHLYRFAISPLFPPSCLYRPSCSAYMLEAVRRHGIVKGSILGVARITRCTHLFFMGGEDPVPEQFSWRAVRTGYVVFKKHRRTPPGPPLDEHDGQS